MERKCELLLYLDKRRFLFSMKTDAEKFLEGLNDKTLRQFPPFRYVLELDVMDLLDLSPDLGMFLMKEPLKVISYCSEILFACLQTLTYDSDQINIQAAQVSVILRLKCISRLMIRPNLRFYSGVNSFCGTLITVSKPLSSVFHTVWSCPEECENNEVILHYIPKVPPKCYACRSVLFENSGLRRCGEQVTVTMKLKNNVLTKVLVITDGLISKLILGKQYNILAIAVRKTLIVCSVEEILPLPAPITSPACTDIEDLYKACDYSPWKFIYCLASSIGVNVSPLNCFMHLKISLLISLASIKANVLSPDSTIVNVLAAGYDTSYVGELMKEASKLADRANFLGTTNTNVGTNLIASSGGVCVMQLPIYSYNPKQIASILSIVESGEIATDAKKEKLMCAIWAHGMDFKKIVLSNIASVFGTVCRGDFGEYNDEIVGFLLENAVEPPTVGLEEIQALKDVALHIDLVAGLKVSLDESAERLLRYYFLSARKERPKAVTIGSMSGLISTCLTSARLCRRTMTNVDDAVFAIWLHVSGSPEPRFAPEEHLQTPDDIKKLQNIIDYFKGWLQQFTGYIL